MTDEGTEESRWYRFNDTVVDEFIMNDAALGAECFGGMYKSKAADGSKYYMVESSGRVKYWRINHFRVLARTTLVNLQQLKHLTFSYFDKSGNLAG